MEGAGYLRRRRDSPDRRLVTIEVAHGEAMQALMARFQPAGEALSGVLADYDEDELSLIGEFTTASNDAI